MIIHLAAENQAQADAFLEAHSEFSEIHVHFGANPVVSALKDALRDTSEDVALVIHADVSLPVGFGSRVRKLVDELSVEWPNWGMVGCSGVAAFAAGYSANNYVNFGAAPGAPPNLAGMIIPATFIEGWALLANTRALRIAECDFEDDDIFEYDAYISVKVLRCGLALLVAPSLSCWHANRVDEFIPNSKADRERLKRFLKSATVNLHFDTSRDRIISSDLMVPDPNVLGAVDVKITSLVNASVGRPRKSVAIITRSTFDRPELLNRCRMTVNAFISEIDQEVTIHHYIVSNHEFPELPNLGKTRFIRSDVPTNVDSRFLLVNASITAIDADFLWFVDDDDWMFPNGAREIALTISAAPKDATIFVDSWRFFETVLPGTPFGSMKLESRFEARNFVQSTSLIANKTPFCGMILPRQQLDTIPIEAFDRITMSEDLFSLIHVLLERGSPPISVDVLAVGISWRERGNSISSAGNAIWRRSFAEVVASIVGSKRVVFPLPAPPEPPDTVPWDEIASIDFRGQWEANPSDTISLMYQSILRRDPDLEGLESHVVAVAGGRSLREVLTSIEESDEAKLADANFPGSRWRFGNIVRDQLLAGFEAQDLKSNAPSSRIVILATRISEVLRRWRQRTRP